MWRERNHGPIKGVHLENLKQWQGNVILIHMEIIIFINLYSEMQVVPGFGHGVLRKTFAMKHLPNDPLFQLVTTK